MPAYIFLAAVATLVVSFAAFAYIRDEVSSVEYIDTDEEWLELVNAAAADDESIAFEESLCRELRLVADGKSSKLEGRLPSQPVAQRAVEAFCSAEAPR